MVCILVKDNIKESLHDHGGVIFCDPPSFPVILFLTLSFWTAQKTATVACFPLPLTPANFWQVLYFTNKLLGHD